MYNTPSRPQAGLSAQMRPAGAGQPSNPYSTPQQSTSYNPMSQGPSSSQVNMQQTAQKRKYEDTPQGNTSSTNNGNGNSNGERKPRPPMPAPYLLASLVPESKMFKDLLEMEHKLDWTMLRKRAEVNDALGRVVKIKRTLRIYLSNTAYNQDWQRAEQNLPEPNLQTGEGIPGWTFKVEGRVLDTNNQRIDKMVKRKFSSLIKTMIVEFGGRDSNNFQESNIVEYHNRQTQPLPGQDGFEIKRRGDQPLEARVMIHLDQYPDRFKVLPPLAGLISMVEGSRAEILSNVWKLIKTVGAQDRDDPTKIVAVGGLEKLMEREKVMPFVLLPDMINRYLTHPDPVILTYQVTVDKERNIHPTVFDIPIEIEDPHKSKMHAAVQSLESGPMLDGIMAAEDEVASLAHQIRTGREKRNFLNEFAKDPADFVNKWLSSQARDLDQILGNEIGLPGTNGGMVREEDLRRSDLFRMPWVEEAVIIKEGIRAAREADVAKEMEMRRREAQMRQAQVQQQQQMAMGMGVPRR